MKPCVRATEPYSGVVTETCHRTHPPTPVTGPSSGVSMLLVIALVVILVGLMAAWAGRVRKYR